MDEQLLKARDLDDDDTALTLIRLRLFGSAPGAKCLSRLLAPPELTTLPTHEAQPS